MRTYGLACVVTACAFLLGGCGQAERPPTEAGDADRAVASPQAESSSCVPANSSAFSAGGIGDAPELTPVENAKSVDLAARVTLIEITDGYRVKQGPDEIRYLYARFTLDSVIADRSASLSEGDEVTVRLDQGSMNNQTGEPSFDIDLFRDALPKGARAILFLNELSRVPEAALEAAEPGSLIYGAPSQGVVFDNCGELTDEEGQPLDRAWAGYSSLEDLESHIERELRR